MSLTMLLRAKMDNELAFKAEFISMHLKRAAKSPMPTMVFHEEAYNIIFKQHERGKKLLKVYNDQIVAALKIGIIRVKKFKYIKEIDL